MTFKGYIVQVLCFVPLFLLIVKENMMKRENKFQAELIKELKQLFPGIVILKNDANYIQGIPDLLLLFKDKWAMLEVKKTGNASHRPNQDYYVSRLNEMSFARFIFPENKEEVLHELEQTFNSRRATRISKRK